MQPKGSFLVVCPAYNREKTLRQALASLQAQEYRDWHCLILDDCSTDGTADVARGFCTEDSRFTFMRPYDENRGGVAMNEVGMTAALACDYWSRLGSDDYFEPHKLLADAVALQEVEACYGPYRVRHESYLDEKFYSFPQPARSTLLSKGFAASWASVAVRSDVLKRVLNTYGAFCDPRIRNMEDWHANTRIASLTDFVWRGVTKDRQVVIGGTSWDDVGGEERFVHDAAWRVAADGASAKSEVIANDARVTQEAIDADFAAHPPLVLNTARTVRTVPLP